MTTDPWDIRLIRHKDKQLDHDLVVLGFKGFDGETLFTITRGQAELLKKSLEDYLDETKLQYKVEFRKNRHSMEDVAMVKDTETGKHVAIFYDNDYMDPRELADELCEQLNGGLS